MGTSIRTQIVKIGNSQGIRIPKILLEQSGLGKNVEIEVNGNCLTIRPMDGPRSGWEDAFATMAEYGDDTLMDAEQTMCRDETEWDETEWDW